MKIQGHQGVAHLKGLRFLPLHYRQAAFKAPELADEAPGQDEQQGQVHQVGSQGPEAALFMEKDLFIRQDLMVSAAQFPAQGAGHQESGVGAPRPGEPGPLRQGEGHFGGEGREGAPPGPGQAVDDAGQDIAGQEGDGRQEPDAVVNAGEAAPGDEGAPKFAVIGEIKPRRLVLLDDGADDRHAGQDQEQKDRETDGGQPPPQRRFGLGLPG